MSEIMQCWACDAFFAISAEEAIELIGSRYGFVDVVDGKHMLVNYATEEFVWLD